jgi:purine-binding chemotaxis protein CheW
MSTNVQDAAKTQNNHSRTFQIVVFRLGHEEYALPIAQIKEVVQTPSITNIPQSPECIKGVSNIRGNIIAIVDLEERFGLRKKTSEASNERGNYTLVVESDELKMGVLVRDVPNTLAIAESAVDQSIVSGDEQSYIKGIVKLEGRLIILIDIFKVMTQKDFGVSLSKNVAA